MSWLLLVAWAAGVTSFTLLGSLYARRYGRVDLLVGLYVAFVLTSQLLATKMAAFSLGMFTFTAPAGVLVFSVTYLLTDIVNEKFGRRETQRMIFIAFIAQIAMTFFVWLGTQFDSAELWSEQGKHWNDLFSAVPQITLASWLAFLVSENADAYIFAFMKKWTGERHLWMRNVVSTLPALAVDSFIFMPLAFYPIDAPLLFSAIWGQIAVKWVVGIVNIPFMYLNHAILARRHPTIDRVLWDEATGE